MGLTGAVTNICAMGGKLTLTTSLAAPAEAGVTSTICLPFHEDKATATPLQNGFDDGEALWRPNNSDEF